MVGIIVFFDIWILVVEEIKVVKDVLFLIEKLVFIFLLYIVKNEE